MEKLLIILNTVLLFFFGSIAPAEAKDFPDVSEDQEFHEAISYASENNIVNGFSDGEFKPYNNISRAELTKILVNYKFPQSEIDSCDIDKYSFPDVDVDYVHAKYICTAKKNNVINGFSDGLFRPEQNVSTPEGVKIISNTYEYTSGNSDNFDKYFEALDSKNALPEAIRWWPEELWRGETMEVLYRLEEGLTDKENINYAQYKEHQVWNEVVIEDAGIRLRVPSWMIEKNETRNNNKVYESIYKIEEDYFKLPFISITIDYDGNYSPSNSMSEYYTTEQEFGNCKYFISEDFEYSFYSTPSSECPEVAIDLKNYNIEFRNVIYDIESQKGIDKYKQLIKTIFQNIQPS